MPILRKVRFTLAKTAARAPLVWARHRNFLPSDAFVGSYPRSGSTWLRFMLLEILSGEASGFSKTNEMLPDVGKHSTGARVLPAGGRLIKTHESFRPEYKKAVYLVRDPHDVALSEFAYQKALGLAGDEFNVYLQRFLRGEVNPFGSWTNHATTWINAADSGRSEILLVCFEELKRNSVQELSRIAEFLGVPVPTSRICEAVANNSMDRMRQKEKADPQRASAKGKFIRSGSAGGWREAFTEEQCQLVQQYAGNIMARIGYAGVESLEGKLV
jgi:Sulfotransferase domain